jgi:hypothetical protein
MPKLIGKSKHKASDFDAKSDQVNCSRSECGKSFDKPIELTIIGADHKSETYDACPHCFHKVTNQPITVPEKKSEKTVPSVPSIPITEIDKEESDEEDKSIECPHSFGHLSRRPKGSSIPDECLTCREITQCMLQRKH